MSKPLDDCGRCGRSREDDDLAAKWLEVDDEVVCPSCFTPEERALMERYVEKVQELNDFLDEEARKEEWNVE